MIEENGYLTEEQAQHLTLHGVNRNEDAPQLEVRSAP